MASTTPGTYSCTAFGTKDADRCVGYITKYLTKQAADCHDVTTGRQRAHLERLWMELRHTPCSERCANWLLYGVQPKKARPGLKPGNCKNKVHKRETLGIGGRRVLISRQWSGKTLTDHRADRRDWVKALLGVTTDADTAPAASDAVRHAWELAKYLHFHDLRHTGNTLAARTGASTRDLMARMGHDSSQAALIYQHATAEADRAIAQALHEALRADRKTSKKSAGGAGRTKDKPGKRSGGKKGKKRSADREGAGDDRG